VPDRLQRAAQLLRRIGIQGVGLRLDRFAAATVSPATKLWAMKRLTPASRAAANRKSVPSVRNRLVVANARSKCLMSVTSARSVILIDNDIRLRRDHGGANRRGVEPVGDRRFRTQPSDDFGLRRRSRRANNAMNGGNQLRNELEANGARGTRNKNRMA
jgi:hypothetical protein